MNTIYRIVWNAATGKWIVASELAKGRKKKSASKIAVLALALAGLGAPVAFAAETDSQEKTEEVGEDKGGTITPFYAIGGGDDGGRADNVAIGSGAATLSQNSVAIGTNAVTNNVANVAIGWGANTTGSNAVSMGYNATANGNYAMSLGGGSSASAARATAVGTDTVASGANATAIGNAAKATGYLSVAIGNSAATSTAAGSSVAIGSNATVTDTGINSVALGQGSVANRANTISVGAVGSERQIVNVAAGTANSDAVNVSQLKGTAESIADVIGGGSTVGADGTITAPNYSVGGTTVHNVGDAISNIDGRVTKNAGDIVNVQNNLTAATRYFKADGQNNGSDDAVASGSRAVAVGAGSAATSAQSIAIGFGAKANTNEGAIAIGANSSATGENSVALGSGSVADRDNVVSVGWGLGSNGTRQIVNVTNGTQNTDAVNVQQLKPAIAALGGGATFNANGTVTGPQYTVADLDNGGNKTVDNVGDALGQLNANTTQLDGRVTKNEGDIVNLDGRVTTNEGDIVDIRNQLGSGSIGLVQQDATSRDITVAAGTDGDRVNFAGTDGARKLAGVAEGELSATSAEAVNGSQLFATNERVTKNEGDIVTIGDRVTSAETNITNLDGRVTKNEGDIIDLGDRINNGSLGLVQQAGASAAVTVAAATGGTIVDITGTDGTRQLKGVSKGEDATDAVNVAQLRDELASVSAGDTRYFKANGANDGTDDAMATGDNAVAIGANARTGGEGAVALGSGAEAKFAGSVAVGEGAAATYANAVAIGAQSSAASSTAVALGTSAKARNSNDTAVGAGAQANLNSTALGQGTTAVNGSTAVGQGATALAANSVALGKGSYANRANSVSVGSAGNERQIVNVADGTQDTDAVNVRQLKSAGLVGDDGSLLDAVVYDAGSNRSAITLGGVAGTTITNVMAGLVAPGSMDAINGSQLWGVQDQINKLGDRVTTIENGTVAPGPTPVNPINPGSENPHFASSGDAAKPATATGSSSVAAGEGAVASGSNSTAIGAGSSATGNNSVAIGAGSVADGDNTVSVGSVGNERRVTNVAAGTQRTDAANVGQLQDAMSNLQDWTQGQVNGLSKKIDNVQRQANRGIAASAALVNNMPYLPGKVTLNAGVAAYRGQSALGVGVSRWNDSGRFNVNAGISAAQGDAPIFRVGVGVVLGD